MSARPRHDQDNEERRAYQRKWHEKHYAKNRAENDAVKEATPCMDCGGYFPACAMDYDHRPGEEKRRGVGMMMHYSKVAIETERAKCDLVCANCHRVRTHRGRDDGSFRIRAEV